MAGWRDAPEEKAAPAWAAAPVDEKWGGALDLPAVGEGFQRAATLGFADEIGGAIQAALPVPGDAGNFFDRYAKWRDAKRADQDAAAARAPGSSLLGGLAGGIVTAPAQMSALGHIPKVGAALKLGLDPTLWQTMVQGGKIGTALGGAAGLGESKKDSVLGTAWDVTKGSAIGGTLGAAIPAAVAGVKALPGAARAVGEVVDPNSYGRSLGKAIEPVGKMVAENEGRAPIVSIASAPGPQGQAAMRDAIRQATKVTVVENAPAPPGAYAWEYAPGPNSSSTLGMQPIGGPPPAPQGTRPMDIGTPGSISSKLLPTGGVKSKAAEFLEDRGAVLTVGYQNPRSPLAQIEEASMSLQGHGPALAIQRGGSNGSIQNVVLNTARAPGSAPVKASGDLWNDLTKVWEGYNRAYEAFRGLPVYPAVHGNGGGALQGQGGSPGLIEKAVAAVENSTDEARSIAARHALNALTRLPERKGAIGQVDLGDILKIRSDIRGEVRTLARGGTRTDLDRKAAYEAVEDVLTAVVESQLPPETAQALRAVDAAYRNYKMVEHAMSRAGISPNGFTPTQLAEGVRLATSKGGFSRGHSDEMWEIAKAWREVTQQITPPTAARMLALDFVPGVGGYTERAGKTTAALRAEAIRNANEQILKQLRD
jgi:hypothetical protein